MSELGQVLQRAREEKGISLEEIQKVTKIQRRYLEAIERGHYHILPGHFYARAFIKSYAEAVGVDPHQLLLHFQTDLPAQPPQDQVDRLRKKRVSTARPTFQAGRWMTSSLLVLFVVMVFGVIYYAAVNNPSAAPDPVPANQTPEANITTPPPTTSIGDANGTAQSPGLPTPAQTGGTSQAPMNPETSKTTVSLASEQGRNFSYTISNAEKMTLKIKAVNGNCWMQIRESKGGKVIEEPTLSKGSEKIVELGKTGYIRLGAPYSVEVYVNDVKVPFTNTDKKPANFELAIK